VGGDLPSLPLNSHVAEFFLAELGDQQIRTSQDEQQDANRYCKNEHGATPFLLNNITIPESKGYNS
jgi:hypothetical protein